MSNTIAPLKPSAYDWTGRIAVEPIIWNAWWSYSAADWALSSVHVEISTGLAGSAASNRLSLRPETIPSSVAARPTPNTRCSATGWR